MSDSRRQLLVVVVYAGLSVLLATCGWEMIRAQAAAQAAAENLQRCQQLAAQIEALKTAPAQASLERQSTQEVATRIERAAQTAGIAGSAITRIDPQAPRRIGKSAHVQQPTHVEIRQVSLEQLWKFLTEMALGESGLVTTSVRLSLPRGSTNATPSESWSAEVVLTHLVFSPEYSPQSSSVPAKTASDE